jgi:hypothetical protein
MLAGRQNRIQVQDTFIDTMANQATCTVLSSRRNVELKVKFAMHIPKGMV